MLDKEKPSYAIIDSQSVKTAYASDERGIEGGNMPFLLHNPNICDNFPCHHIS